MIHRLRQLAKLSKSEQQVFVLDRLEILYHKKQLTTQMVLDCVAPNILPGSEEYITCEQEISFLTSVSYQDLEVKCDDSNDTIIEQTEWYQKTIEVDILSSMQLQQSVVLKEITLEADVKEEENYQACLLPQEGALPSEVQNFIQSLEQKGTAQYWKGKAYSILVVVSQESLEQIQFYIDHKVNVRVVVS